MHTVDLVESEASSACGREKSSCDELIGLSRLNLSSRRGPANRHVEGSLLLSISLFTFVVTSYDQRHLGSCLLSASSAS
jgi:hypothetical protein